MIKLNEDNINTYRCSSENHLYAEPILNAWNKLGESSFASAVFKLCLNEDDPLSSRLPHELLQRIDKALISNYDLFSSIFLHHSIINKFLSNSNVFGDTSIPLNLNLDPDPISPLTMKVGFNALAIKPPSFIPVGLSTIDIPPYVRGSLRKEMDL